MIRVDSLKRHFDVSGGWLTRVLDRRPLQIVRAVDGVTFDLNKGETLSLVGESGSGKSTVGRMIVGLERPDAGSIVFEGQDLTKLNPNAARRLRRRMQMIFQDPFASLNPRWRVRSLVAEALGDIEKSERRAEVGRLLRQVGLQESDGDKFPHEFSGGQRQRICIARALASKPEFLVCDEPTSALDVSVQAQILNLMRDLQSALNLTYLFISHNLAVVQHVSTRVGVLYLGRFCELATRDQIFKQPRHPYTRMLLDSIPDVSLSGRPRTPVQGEVPSPINPPSGCAFHPRCPLANARCKVERPELLTLPDGVAVACHAVEEGRTA